MMSENGKDFHVLEERINGVKDLFLTRLESQEKLFGTRFDAGEKYSAMVSELAREAVAKAESAQGGVNERSNEFRGQLADQAATLMPRKETEAALFALRELVDREMAALRSDVASLRETRSEESGSKDQGRWLVATILAVVGTAISVYLLMR